MNKLIAIIGLMILLVVLLHACQKPGEEPVPKIRSGSYIRNDLSIPVYFQNGFRIIWGDRDTILITEPQIIHPGEILPYQPYPTILSGTTSPRTSPRPSANTVWISISERIKRDYDCYIFPSESRTSCEKDSINFFNMNSGKWTQINHTGIDSISLIYSIDAKDSLEAQ